MKEDCIEFEPQTHASVRNGCCNGMFSLTNFPNGSTDFYFYMTEDDVIVATFTHDGQLKMSVSYDCGRTFSNAGSLIKIENPIKDFNILFKGKQFVISIVESNSSNGQDIKKAISGALNPSTQSFTHKECVRFIPEKGKINNISLGFQNSTTVANAFESIDYVFTEFDGTIVISCQGHPCEVKLNP